MNIVALSDPYRPVEYRWQAIDRDTYDGAPDSPTRDQIGWGRSCELAIADLKAKLAGDTP